MATQTQTFTQRPDFLRRVLQMNSLVSTLSGLLFILAAGSIAEFLGLDKPSYVMALGIVILLFAAEVYWITRQNPLRRSDVFLVFLLDLAWVVVSAAILLTGWPSLTSEGKWAVLIAADAVAIFAAFEYYGLRRLRSL